MSTATADYTARAAALANNHAKFRDFAWFERPADSEKWAIIYTDNRDSGPIDRANAQEIGEALARFPRHAIAECHNHWACGHVNGYRLRVYDSRGRITQACKVYCDLLAALENYPVLNDETLSKIESEEIDDSWDSWLAAEFQKQLDKDFAVDFPAVAFGGFDIPADKCRALFDKACSAAGRYPEHTGSEVTCDVARIASEVTCDDVREFAPVDSVKLFRNGAWLTNGQQQLDHVTADCELYADELLAAMIAADDGAQSLTLGADVYTWQIN